MSKNANAIQLRPYQREAVAKALPLMQDGGGFGLWLEQRTGKTLTALAIANRVQPAHLWVICPKAGGAAPEVWWREIGRWMKVHHGLNDTQIRIENYEQWVSKRKNLYKEAKSLRDLMIICDESHYIKARGAARSRVVRKLGRFARWRLALTGTPIAQGIHDAWAQFDFIDPAVFGKFDNTYEDPKTKKILLEEGFEGRYIVRGGYKKHDIVKFKNEDEFYRKFHAHSYRKTLREAREKPLMLKYTQVPVELKKTARTHYEELKRDLITEVNKKKIKVKNVLASLIKLQQVTGGSVLIAAENGADKPELIDISREKIHALSVLVTRTIPREAKFVVIARFRHEIDRIALELSRLGYNVGVVRGGEPYDGKFKHDCLVMQIQSGIAVDMSQADYIIGYSIDFSMINFEQARFRILDFHKPVGHYYFLNASDTIDEDIYLAITRKKHVAKLVCDTYRTRPA
jgi:superfamily II DNA or RNA helicase